MTVEDILFDNRAFVQERATRYACMADVEHWFYSTFWDDLPSSELARVRSLLGQDQALRAVLGSARDIVSCEQNETTD